MLNVDKLAALLTEAKAAHKAHAEADATVDHKNWPKWYAAYMAEKLAAEASERPKTEGHHENERNERNRDLYADMIKEAHNVTTVIVGHHLVYEDKITGPDGFVYHVPAEIPSADALIFDHHEARIIWGEDEFEGVLVRLALEPVATRDDVLRQLYYNRSK